MHPSLGPATGEALHLMTYNLRYPADDPGHPWADRRPAMAALLDLERPTVIGTQEGYYRQLRDLASDLRPDYAWIGVGREGGSRGEYAAVFYDAARLDPVEYVDLWLSDTPALIGSASCGNRIPRMATWVRFADSATGGEFVVLNTHLDHGSENARRCSADLLADQVQSFAGTPTIVTGDFNTPAARSPTYDRLVTATSLEDTWLTAERRLTPEYATYGGYRQPVPGDRIDWLLTTPDIVAEAVAAYRDRHDITDPRHPLGDSHNGGDWTRRADRRRAQKALTEARRLAVGNTTEGRGQTHDHHHRQTKPGRSRDI